MMNSTRWDVFWQQNCKFLRKICTLVLFLSTQYATDASVTELNIPTYMNVQVCESTLYTNVQVFENV